MDNIETEKKWHRIFRKVLVTLSILGLPVSLLLLYGSVFVYDGSTLMWARHGIVVSAIFLPIFLIVALILNKRLYFFIPPLISVISLISFDIILNAHLDKTNIEFCKDKFEYYERYGKDEFFNDAQTREYCRKLLEE